jgi:two-component system sensor histidine kinase PilS (NtrC family)
MAVTTRPAGSSGLRTVEPSPAASLVGIPPATAGASELERRLTYLMLGRTLVISVVLGLNLWLLLRADVATSAVAWLLSALIAATYLITIVSAVLMRRGVAAEKLVWPQLAADLAVTSILVLVTGGAQSAYAFFFALSVVAAGALTYTRGVVVVGLVSLVLMVLIALLAWRGASPLPTVPQIEPWLQSTRDFAGSLGQNAAAIAAVGVLAYIFGDQLQKATVSLATERRTVADLVSLHQDIVRSLSSGLVTVDLDGTIVTANEAACEILGAPAARWVGKPVDAALPGLRERLGGGDRLRRADLEIRRGDDDRRALGVTVSPLRDEGERVVGQVINFQDLTELRAMEASMRRAERLATIGQLAAGIAHEIRNPLASISGSVELLRQAPQVTEDDRALMAIVTREIERLDALISDILELTNPRKKQTARLDVGVLVDETLAMFRQDPAVGTVAVEALPRDGDGLAIEGDPGKLRQVVWNLLRNAADAVAHGGTAIKIGIRREADRAVIEVADDGPGIPADVMPRIFDPFFSTKDRGTGLGLATSQAIVGEHGGTVEAESTLGTGTRFTVRLPLA